MATCPVCNSTIDDDASACPYCGFKLLGATQRFEPIALDDEARPPEPPARLEAELRVVRGPQTGVAFKLSNRALSVGRSPQCDIFLNDMTVSRRHAVIEPVEGGFAIKDENSFNGVWVDNENVERRTLADGDVIQIGAFCLVYKQD